MEEIPQNVSTEIESEEMSEYELEPVEKIPKPINVNIKTCFLILKTNKLNCRCLPGQLN